MQINHESDLGSNMQEIDEIDTSRDKAKITRKALCARAGIDADTYTRIAKRRNEPNLRTMRRLRAALEALLEEAKA